MCRGPESDGLSMWELYRESSHKGYLDSGSEGHKLLQGLLNQVERLPAPACRTLLESFTTIARQVWRGTSTMSSELQTVQVVPHKPPSPPFRKVPPS